MRSIGLLSCQLVFLTSVATALPSAMADSPFDGQWSGSFDVNIKTKQVNSTGGQSFIRLGDGGDTAPTCSCQMSAVINMESNNPSAKLKFSNLTSSNPKQHDECSQLLKSQCDDKEFSNSVTLSDDNIIALSIDHFDSQQCNFLFNLVLENGQITANKIGTPPLNSQFSVTYDITLQRN